MNTKLVEIEKQIRRNERAQRKERQRQLKEQQRKQKEKKLIEIEAKKSPEETKELKKLKMKYHRKTGLSKMEVDKLMKKITPQPEPKMDPKKQSFKEAKELIIKKDNNEERIRKEIQNVKNSLNKLKGKKGVESFIIAFEKKIEELKSKL